MFLFKMKICCALLVYLLCLVNKSYERTINCSFIDNLKSAVEITCIDSANSTSNSSVTTQNDCYYDLYESDASYSNRAKVRMLRIHNQTCDTLNYINKKFTALQEIEYSMSYMSLFEYLSIGTVIRANTDLEKLNFTYNSVNRLTNEFTYGVIHLMFVNCSHNQIVDIESEAFFGAKNLETLDLSYNNIDVLDKNLFRNTPKLRILRLEQNPFKHFDCHLIQPLKNLEQINFNYDHINTLNLNCAECSIVHQTTIAANESDFKFPVIQGLPSNLKHFNVAGCRIPYISRILQLLSRTLQTLDISSNNCDTLETRHTSTIRQFENSCDA